LSSCGYRVSDGRNSDGEQWVFERIFLPIVDCSLYGKKEAKASEVPKAFGTENERKYSLLDCYPATCTLVKNIWIKRVLLRLFLQKSFRVSHEIPVDPVMLGFFIADFSNGHRVEAEDLRIRAGQDDR
jgi:hypothetical protein